MRVSLATSLSDDTASDRRPGPLPQAPRVPLSPAVKVPGPGGGDPTLSPQAPRVPLSPAVQVPGPGDPTLSPQAPRLPDDRLAAACCAPSGCKSFENAADKGANMRECTPGSNHDLAGSKPLYENGAQVREPPSLRPAVLPVTTFAW